MGKGFLCGNVAKLLGVCTFHHPLKVKHISFHVWGSYVCLNHVFSTYPQAVWRGGTGSVSVQGAASDIMTVEVHTD